MPASDPSGNSGIFMIRSAWVALTPSNEANGAKGTHTRDQIPHRDTFHKYNLLTRGQEIEVEVDPQKL
jgi:non-haem Fe2+, alpha-ketoglutarate-dependent halogenase